MNIIVKFFRPSSTPKKRQIDPQASPAVVKVRGIRGLSPLIRFEPPAIV